MPCHFLPGGLIICGPGAEWGRTMINCPYCKDVVKALERPVFGGYGADVVCGGCGSKFYDGEGVFEKDGAVAMDNIAFVAEEWPKARPAADLFREEARKMGWLGE